MGDARTVECPEHGPRPEAFVCRHIAESLHDRKVVGFHWALEEHSDRPDAWCDECDGRLESFGGEWVGQPVEHLGVRLLCGVCYDRARELNLSPPFDEACRRFRAFLASNGCDGPLEWAFREDLYQNGSGNIRVRWSLAEANHDLAREFFELGRRKGLVGVYALCRCRESIVTTVLAPEPDEIQGWPDGILKLSIALPLWEAKPVNRLLWRLHERSSGYSRHQLALIAHVVRKHPAALGRTVLPLASGLPTGSSSMDHKEHPGLLGEPAATLSRWAVCCLDRFAGEDSSGAYSPAPHIGARLS